MSNNTSSSPPPKRLPSSILEFWSNGGGGGNNNNSNSNNSKHVGFLNTSNNSNCTSSSSSDNSNVTNSLLESTNNTTAAEVDGEGEECRYEKSYNTTTSDGNNSSSGVNNNNNKKNTNIITTNNDALTTVVATTPTNNNNNNDNNTTNHFNDNNNNITPSSINNRSNITARTMNTTNTTINTPENVKLTNSNDNNNHRHDDDDDDTLIRLISTPDTTDDNDKNNNNHLQSSYSTPEKQQQQQNVLNHNTSSTDKYVNNNNNNNSTSNDSGNSSSSSSSSIVSSRIRAIQFSMLDDESKRHHNTNNIDNSGSSSITTVNQVDSTTNKDNSNNNNNNDNNNNNNNISTNSCSSISHGNSNNISIHDNNNNTTNTSNSKMNSGIYDIRGHSNTTTTSSTSHSNCVMEESSFVSTATSNASNKENNNNNNVVDNNSNDQVVIINDITNDSNHNDTTTNNEKLDNTLSSLHDNNDEDDDNSILSTSSSKGHNGQQEALLLVENHHEKPTTNTIKKQESIGNTSALSASSSSTARIRDVQQAAVEIMMKKQQEIQQKLEQDSDSSTSIYSSSSIVGNRLIDSSPSPSNGNNNGNNNNHIVEDNNKVQQEQEHHDGIAISNEVQTDIDASSLSPSEHEHENTNDCYNINNNDENQNYDDDHYEDYNHDYVHDEEHNHDYVHDEEHNHDYVHDEGHNHDDVHDEEHNHDVVHDEKHNHDYFHYEDVNNDYNRDEDHNRDYDHDEDRHRKHDYDHDDEINANDEFSQKSLEDEHEQGQQQEPVVQYEDDRAMEKRVKDGHQQHHRRRHSRRLACESPTPPEELDLTSIHSDDASVDDRHHHLSLEEDGNHFNSNNNSNNPDTSQQEQEINNTDTSQQEFRQQISQSYDQSYLNDFHNKSNESDAVLANLLSAAEQAVVQAETDREEEEEKSTKSVQSFQSFSQYYNQLAKDSDAPTDQSVRKKQQKISRSGRMKSVEKRFDENTITTPAGSSKHATLSEATTDVHANFEKQMSKYEQRMLAMGKTPVRSNREDDPLGLFDQVIYDGNIPLKTSKEQQQRGKVKEGHRRTRSKGDKKPDNNRRRSKNEKESKKTSRSSNTNGNKKKKGRSKENENVSSKRKKTNRKSDSDRKLRSSRKNNSNDNIDHGDDSSSVSTMESEGVGKIGFENFLLNAFLDFVNPDHDDDDDGSTYNSGSSESATYTSRQISTSFDSNNFSSLPSQPTTSFRTESTSLREMEFHDNMNEHDQNQNSSFQMIKEWWKNELVAAVVEDAYSAAGGSATEYTEPDDQTSQKAVMEKLINDEISRALSGEDFEFWGNYENGTDEQNNDNNSNNEYGDNKTLQRLIESVQQTIEAAKRSDMICGSADTLKESYSSIKKEADKSFGSFDTLDGLVNKIKHGTSSNSNNQGKGLNGVGERFREFIEHVQRSMEDSNSAVGSEKYSQYQRHNQQTNDQQSASRTTEMLVQDLNVSAASTIQTDGQNKMLARTENISPRDDSLDEVLKGGGNNMFDEDTTQSTNNTNDKRYEHYVRSRSEPNAILRTPENSLLEQSGSTSASQSLSTSMSRSYSASYFIDDDEGNALPKQTNLKNKGWDHNRSSSFSAFSKKTESVSKTSWTPSATPDKRNVTKETAPDLSTSTLQPESGQYSTEVVSFSKQNSFRRADDTPDIQPKPRKRKSPIIRVTTLSGNSPPTNSNEVKQDVPDSSDKNDDTKNSAKETCEGMIEDSTEKESSEAYRFNFVMDEAEVKDTATNSVQPNIDKEPSESNLTAYGQEMALSDIINESSRDSFTAESVSDVQNISNVTTLGVESLNLSGKSADQNSNFDSSPESVVATTAESTATSAAKLNKRAVNQSEEGLTAFGQEWEISDKEQSRVEDSGLSLLSSAIEQDISLQPTSDYEESDPAKNESWTDFSQNDFDNDKQRRRGSPRVLKRLGKMKFIKKHIAPMVGSRSKSPQKKHYSTVDETASDNHKKVEYKEISRQLLANKVVRSSDDNPVDQHIRSIHNSVAISKGLDTKTNESESNHLTRGREISTIEAMTKTNKNDESKRFQESIRHKPLSVNKGPDTKSHGTETNHPTPDREISDIEAVTKTNKNDESKRSQESLREEKVPESQTNNDPFDGECSFTSSPSRDRSDSPIILEKPFSNDEDWDVFDNSKNFFSAVKLNDKSGSDVNTWKQNNNTVKSFKTCATAADVRPDEKRLVSTDVTIEEQKAILPNTFKTDDNVANDLLTFDVDETCDKGGERKHTKKSSLNPGVFYGIRPPSASNSFSSASTPKRKAALERISTTSSNLESPVRDGIKQNKLANQSQTTKSPHVSPLRRQVPGSSTEKQDQTSNFERNHNSPISRPNCSPSARSTTNQNTCDIHSGSDADVSTFDPYEGKILDDSWQKSPHPETKAIAPGNSRSPRISRGKDFSVETSNENSHQEDTMKIHRISATEFGVSATFRRLESAFRQESEKKFDQESTNRNLIQSSKRVNNYLATADGTVRNRAITPNFPFDENESKIQKSNDNTVSTSTDNSMTKQSTSRDLSGSDTWDTHEFPAVDPIDSTILKSETPGIVMSKQTKIINSLPWNSSESTFSGKKISLSKFRGELPNEAFSDPSLNFMPKVKVITESFASEDYVEDEMFLFKTNKDWEDFNSSFSDVGWNFMPGQEKLIHDQSRDDEKTWSREQDVSGSSDQVSIEEDFQDGRVLYEV